MSASPPKKRRACPGRKRGGQPANTIALKHGIYSRYYTPEELLALDQDVAGSLKDETEILRLTIAEAADSVLQQPEADIPFHDHVSALRTIAVSIARLENVIHTRMFVFGDPDRREKQVNAILERLEQSELDGVGTCAGSPSRYHPGVFLGHRPGVLPGSTPEGEHPVGVPPAASVPGPGFAPGEVASACSSEKGRLSLKPPKKTSGSQPGNSNAWKHGFYARAFTPAEKNRLQGDEADQLRYEETLLRVLILRAWRSLRSVRSTITWQEYLFTLRSICYAIFVIVKLQRARRRLFGDSTDLEKDIQQGLDEARKDLGINDFLHPQEE
jgi:hypothetical protein